jgi:hypothetical protein
MIWLVPLAILCGWEIRREGSGVVRSLAVLTLLNVLSLLGYAIFRVTKIAQASCNEHRNHAVLLFGDESVLSKWGFLFSEYKSCCSYFIIPRFVYLVLKSLFMAIPQDAPIVAVVATFILDLAFFTLLVIFRPHLDTTVNFMAIAVISMTLLNSTLLLLFSNIFGLPVKIPSRTFIYSCLLTIT